MPKRQITIHRDESAESPRERSNVGVLIVKNQRQEQPISADGEDDDYTHDLADWIFTLAIETDPTLDGRFDKLEEEGWNALYAMDNVTYEGADNVTAALKAKLAFEVFDKEKVVIFPLMGSVAGNGMNGVIVRKFPMDRKFIMDGTGKCALDDFDGLYVAKKGVVDKEFHHYSDRFRIRQAVLALRAEVETFSMWMSGQVFGYQIDEWDEDGECWDEVDSCWGFYGDTASSNGMAANAPAVFTINCLVASKFAFAQIGKSIDYDHDE